MKRIGYTLCALVMMLVLLPTNTADAAASGDFRYSVTGGEATVTYCVRTVSGEVTVPSVIDGYPVTAIGSEAFTGCKELTGIIIPEGVTSIGDQAFMYCTKLTEIRFPSTLCRVGYLAFSDTPWADNQPDGAVYTGRVLFDYKGECPETAVIRDGTVTVGIYAFSEQDTLKSVVIPDSVATIEAEAFSGCDALEEIRLPASVTEIVGGAFFSCPSLDRIDVDAGNPVYHSDGDCLIETATDTVIKGCNNSRIPPYIKKVAFGAFQNCPKLTALDIPASVTDLDGALFGKCTALESIRVDAGNPVYRSEGNCLIETASATLLRGCRNSRIPDGVVSVKYDAFSECVGLTEVTLPDSVTRLGSGAFRDCTDLRRVVLPDGLTKLESGMFSGCRSLTEVTWPANLTQIDGGAFKGCTSLRSLTLPESVTKLGLGAFRDCTGLTVFTVPRGVARVDQNAFMGCTSLTAVVIPKSVTYIDWEAFSGCNNLRDVWYGGNSRDDLHILSRNEPLTEAVWHFNTCEEHRYAGEADRTCEDCEWVRSDENRPLTDGTDDSNDVRFLLRVITALTESLTDEERQIADRNGDGSVDTMDVRALLRSLITD